ncbi:hypothetical protein Tamer19_57570 [Cupriavidus sp. TA19]|nr:hypothetical protein Tamer19_57570 [Cupriavidus sp. TA19]
MSKDMQSKVSPATFRLAPLIVVSAAGLVLSACGGGGDDNPPPPSKTPVACQNLPGKTVAAGSIGLPTNGATVADAVMVPATGGGQLGTGAYCKVTGTIAPVDPTAPSIRFEVDMPASWNQKVVMFGGGGYDGTIPNTAGNVPAGPTDQPSPLARGYATFASDSGHQAGALGSRDGSFGTNDEAVRNFSSDALKKTRDVAIALIQMHYQADGPKKAYFAGGSSGGREALAVVQRWPQDWDGAIVLYPAWNAASLTCSSAASPARWQRRVHTRTSPSARCSTMPPSPRAMTSMASRTA